MLATMKSIIIPTVYNIVPEDLSTMYIAALKETRHEQLLRKLLRRPLEPYTVILATRIENMPDVFEIARNFEKLIERVIVLDKSRVLSALLLERCHTLTMGYGEAAREMEPGSDYATLDLKIVFRTTSLGSSLVVDFRFGNGKVITREAFQPNIGSEDTYLL